MTSISVPAIGSARGLKSTFAVCNHVAASRRFSSAVTARQDAVADQASSRSRKNQDNSNPGRPQSNKQRPPRTIERHRPESVITSASRPPQKRGDDVSSSPTSAARLPFVLPKTDWWNSANTQRPDRPTLQPVEDTPCQAVPARPAGAEGAMPKSKTLRDARQSLQVRVNFSGKFGPRRGHGAKPIAYNGPLSSVQERREMELRERVAGDASQYQSSTLLKLNDTQVVKTAADALSTDSHMKLELKFWTVDKIRELQDAQAIQAANAKLIHQRKTTEVEVKSSPTPEPAKAKGKGKGGRK
ncbi:hypothetical protein IE81DRAFT_323113 [Ceraceosorus guamensis]|uniref:Uncharacterized protein n=1 Tax=Ceraceosorus guamensis TaxID=1522189 RepID=A0A316VZ74_9BASI|nr:hypothetical protein IE81DRAFT_323113 [Ceraceosorus guamensis]PWN42762.1 hypothetical protein IE81DRAFT_323113 [Ceraceosorus guamensis]